MHDKDRTPRGIRLDSVVPWGRSFDEYVAMFALTPGNLVKRILGAADGPAAFNAAMHARGRRVVSVDPIYAFSAEEIRVRIAETHATVVAALEKNPGGYHWDTIPNPRALGEHRMAAMNEFLADYDRGREEGRYVAGSLPRIDAPDDAFDLALSSHLLFLYSEQLDAELHVAAVRELLRVAREVRIFPVIRLDCSPSPHLPGVLRVLGEQGHRATLEPVSYRFQKGADHMLRIRRGD